MTTNRLFLPECSCATFNKESSDMFNRLSNSQGTEQYLMLLCGFSVTGAGGSNLTIWLRPHCENLHTAFVAWWLSA